jgi:hypothetical protein
MSGFAGFDVCDFPGAEKLAAVKKASNFAFIAPYLASLSHPAKDWTSAEVFAALRAQGWGLAPVYVGQQIVGPGSNVVTAAQGLIDGRDACAKMASCGFKPGSFVFLDLENGPPITGQQWTYIEAWAAAVATGGFGVGVYCSFLLAREVHERLPDARLWVFHVKTTSPHKVPGTNFNDAHPALSGAPEASMWQWDDSAWITVGGVRLFVDLDTSALADPSAPD